MNGFGPALSSGSGPVMRKSYVHVFQQGLAMHFLDVLGHAIPGRTGHAIMIV